MLVGEAPQPARRRWLRGATCCLLAGLARPAAWAIDNPDAPDWTAAFNARAKPLEDRWAADAGSAAGPAAARAYAQFLDAELNQAYQALLKQLKGEARRALVQSQRQWLAFREAEHRFIDSSFTPQAFGSSATLSRADYRASLVKQRVLSLLAYLQNYPAPP